MAPGLRTDAGGGGEAVRCWRSRWSSRGAAAGMLLAAGMLSLLARCAVAAEEKSTFDASGFSSLLSDPSATAAPNQRVADLAAAEEEVPFSATQSEGDSESDARGLSGQAAFSSVLTVKAGTVNHPSSQDQSKTLATFTRDENHTTKWPSRNSSHGSQMSSSSLSKAGDRIHPTSSGRTPSMPRQQHTAPRHDVTMSSLESEPLHVLTVDVKKTNSSFLSSPSPSLSSPAPSTSSVLSSYINRLNRATSSQGQHILSSPAASPVTSLASHLPAAFKWGLTTSVPPRREKNDTTEKTLGLNTSSIDLALTKPPATRKAYYFPEYGNYFKTFNEPTETHTQSVSAVSENDPEINTWLSSNHRNSARLSVPSNASQQTKPPPVRHKSYGNATASPLNSHITNPRASPAATFTPAGYFFTASSDKPPDTESLSEIQITNLTPISSGSPSLERASIRDDLPMAAGHGLAAVDAINENNKLAVDENKSVFFQVLEKNMYQKPDISTGLITRGGTTFVTKGLFEKTMFPSGLILTKFVTDENLSNLPSYFSPFVRSDILNQDEGLSSSNELNLLERTKPTLSHKPKPSDRPVQATPSLNLDSEFGSVPTSHNSHQMASSSGEVFARNKNSERADHSKPSTLQVQTDAESSKSSPAWPGHVTNGRSFAENLDRDASFPLFHEKEGNILSNTKSFLSTPHFQSLPTEAPDEDVTVTGPYRSSSSSWSKIIPTHRTTSASPAQGPAVFVSSHKSKFYSGTQSARPGTAFSAASPSPGDGQNSTSETLNPISTFGTTLMAAYTKWRASNLVSFQRVASESHTTPSSFKPSVSDLAADGLSYQQHPGLEGGQEHKMHILYSVAPTFTASDPYVLHSTDGADPPPSHRTEGSYQDEENPDFFLGNLKVGMTADNTDATSVWTPRTPPAISHATTDSVTSSKDTVLAYVYKITAARLPRSFTDTDDVGDPVRSELKGSETPALAVLSTRVTLSGLSSDRSTSSVSSPDIHPISSAFSSPEVTSSSSFEPTEFPDIVLSSTSLPMSPPSHSSTDTSVDLTEAASADELSAGTSRAVALTFLKENEDPPPPPSQSTAPTDRTSQVPPLTPRPDITPASVKPSTTTAAASTTKTENPFPVASTTSSMPSLGGVASPSTPVSTTHLTTPVTRRFTSTTTIRTQTSRRTFTPFVLRTVPPRAATTAFISPFTTTTEATPQQCNITERMWVKTVVSIYVRRNRLDSIQRQNLRRGLSQGLRKALNDSSAQAQVETVFGSPNMTVAYHVTGGDVVYPPSVVLDGLESYGRDKLIADLRQYLPMVTALPLPAALWRASPASTFQLKTVLQFVGADDNPRTCRFSQMMERRLERVFLEAQVKVLSSNSKLTVQMLSVTQTTGSPAVSLVYTVSNGTVLLNGTTASNLLGQLSAELVGYFLFYPPLTVAEPLEYHNLNTSLATKDFWVITVIQDVDNTSLEGQYQSFASLMEQRLAELFVLAGQQGTRFRRAATVDSYTVQMVGIRRVSGMKNPAEMTYYVQHNGIPLAGTSAAKVLNTVDSQIMALTLGYFVQLQAEPVVKNPPNNLWIIAAVLAPISVVTLIIIIITAVLCRKNKNDFKADAIGNLNPRAKMAYRRDVGFYHQPVQGFDYAKQHLGRQGGEEETLPVSQDTLVMSLKLRDTPLSLEKTLQQDGTAHKKSLSSDKQKSKLPSEDGSVISNESEKPNSGRGLTAPKVTAQQKLTKEEMRKREDPYDTSSGSLQLISIKPVTTQPSYSHHASSDRSQDSIIVNGEVNLALKQKSDIEHYRNKLRLKAKRKGYYDFPSTNGSSSSRVPAQRQRQSHERSAVDQGRPLEPEDDPGSTYVKSQRRHSQVGQTAYRSRQSLSSPSPGGTEMDLLVMRERPRKGIRNSGYDTEPELIEETNVDRLVGTRGYLYGRGLKGHSETSTLSSQPSIDEVRQQMHLLLEEAFTLASGGQSTIGRQSHLHQPSPDPYSPAAPSLPYAEVVTSAPSTMGCGQGGLQWVPSYGADLYQCSLPKPAFRFTQLPEMASPPPLPPRTEPPPGKSVRRSTSDLGPKGRSSEKSVREMQSHHDTNPYGPNSRAVLPSISADQPLSNYSGNPITAVYAIPASRSGYSEYFLSSPPTSYHSPSWMSYPPEPEDVPPQWADSLPLPGYVEAFPHPRYPQSSPTRLPLEYKQSLEQPSLTPSTSSQQNLPQVVKDIDSIPLSSLSTSALVQAIRQEVAKLAKKQNEMFEF